MDFTISEDQEMVAGMVRKFAQKHIRPKMMEWDETQEFPVEVFKKLGELGLMGVLVPVKYEGVGWWKNFNRCPFFGYCQRSL